MTKPSAFDKAAPDAIKGDEGKAKKPTQITRMNANQWREICRELEVHHAVFYKLWEMGKPIFSDAVETAAIQFDRGGDFVYFHFNPEFWEYCTPYERLFTICHEA